MGVKDRYEQFHHVEYTHEAIEAAVYQSSRYITDRFLPDKAIDLVDEAGARAKLKEAGYSEEFGEINKSIRVAVEQMENAVSQKDFERAQFYREQEVSARENLQFVREKFDVKSSRAKGHRQQGRHRRGRVEVDRRADRLDQPGRRRQAPSDGGRSPQARDQPGEGDLGDLARHPPFTRRAEESEPPGRQLHLPRTDRRRQDRARPRARQLPLRQRQRADSLRHVRVHGEALGVEADWLASRLRRPRRRRPADREGEAQPVLGGAARRDREGAPGHLQHPAAGVRRRPPHGRPRQPGELQEHDHHHDVEHRRALHPEEGVARVPGERRGHDRQERAPTWCSAR